ncbi:hypothetical protein [Levilinea saccharolytica]|uniref:hypothetical protein n=1 Tax=Levilinea saccharolytica TaxID=229921 RepID=UPI0011BEB6B9|nr:hypothetical protein [Levilinea saccharolytica]
MDISDSNLQKKGCTINSKADISFKQVTLFYASVNLILSGTSNFGYNPTQSGTTFYGAVGNRDDWAETYAVMALENAGYSLEQDQANVWEERKMIIKLWLNK